MEKDISFHEVVTLEPCWKPLNESEQYSQYRRGSRPADSRGLFGLADGYRLGRHARLCPLCLHAHGCRRGYVGGHGLRAALRPSRGRHGRALQCQYAQGRTNSGRDRDLACLGPMDHGQGGSGDGSTLAPHRLDQSELAHARHLLQAHDIARFRNRAVL